MQFMEDELSQIMESVWESFLGMPVERTAAQDDVSGSGGTVTGWVAISGAWQGGVMLECPVEIARHAATVLFQVPLEEVGSEQFLDTVKELTNMTGGNLKALLPPPCALGLPQVVQGGPEQVAFPAQERLSRLCFKRQGQRLWVTLVSSEVTEPVGGELLN